MTDVHHGAHLRAEVLREHGPELLVPNKQHTRFRTLVGDAARRVGSPVAPHHGAPAIAIVIHPSVPTVSRTMMPLGYDIQTQPGQRDAPVTSVEAPFPCA